MSRGTSGGRARALGLGLLLLATASCGGGRADLVLRGGAVYTMQPEAQWSEAVAVRDGRIVFVGPDALVERWIGPGTRVERIPGRMVLPGLHDSHVHPLTGGLELGECDLNGLEARAEILSAIGRCAVDLPNGAWLRGAGWALPAFPGANPSRRLLDSLVPDRPAYLAAMDEHSAWVNSRALAAAGITRETPDPPGGRIERGPGGVPSGTLRESAMGLVQRLLPAYTLEDRIAALRRVLPQAHAVGLTSLVEANATPEMLEAYAALERSGGLTARVVAAQRVDPDRGPEQVEDLLHARDGLGGRRFRPTAAKIFADGVIESGTAALLEPYLDRPGDRGDLRLPAGRLDTLVAALDRVGLDVHIHAIGDRAVRASLDAIERARRVNGPRDARHLLAHIQLIDPEDVPRFRALGVIAGFQPLWAQRDRYIAELTEPRLGPGRSRWLYPIASVARTGAVLAAGSDWTVSSLAPLEAIQVALTRRGVRAGVEAPWIPEEVADLSTMLAAYTVGGAYASRQEREVGRVAVGMAADLVVLERNLFDVPPGEIGSVRVLLTLVEGIVVHRDSSLAP